MADLLHESAPTGALRAETVVFRIIEGEPREKVTVPPDEPAEPEEPAVVEE